jgi:demethylmenaquinone methyltransferase/2-methoxy-6-polyprenyl-1,4-benzoquinol methylase
VYDLYSFAAMPLVGKILVGSWGAYAYLTDSIHLFPYSGELSGILAGQGFSRVTFHPLSNGIAVAHLRPESQKNDELLTS